MKNLNSIISHLSRSGLLSRKARMYRANTDEGSHKQNPLKAGAFSAVGGLAWNAYQVYSEQPYGRNTRLQKANLQRAYQLGVYAQKNAQKHNAAQNQAISETIQTPATAQSRYIPSSPKQTLTYSPATLSQQQFDQVVQDETQDTGQILILRAMITAANADGHIDDNERQRIYHQVDEFDLSIKDKAKLFDELRNPLSLEQLVDTIPDSQTAIEVYAASLLAIDEQQSASQYYLSHLASSMKLPLELVEAMHKKAEDMR